MKGKISTSEISKVFDKYYWPKIDGKKTSKYVVTAPLLDLADHIGKAFKAGLKRRSECAYAGSELLFSVLERTDKKYSYNIDETNELYKKGKSLAGDVWDALDEGLPLTKIKEQLYRSLWNNYYCYSKKRSGD